VIFKDSGPNVAVAIGTTTSTSNKADILRVGNVVGAIAISTTNHTYHSGTAPTALSTGCGTSASLLAGSNDRVGSIVIGTTPGASCTMTFAKAWRVAPVCFVQNRVVARAYNVPTTLTTMAFAGALGAGDNSNYVCHGIEVP